MQTGIPLRLTSITFGFMNALDVPTAANTRPQFGSPPKIAAFNKLFRAQARATSTASDSEAAFLTFI